MPSITIAIPIYNEEENIEWVIKDTLKTLPEYFKDWEIIAINDGSEDKTEQILNKLVLQNPKLKIIHQKHGGYSKAMLTGIKAATKDYIAYLPADGQFLVSDMRHCFKIMSKNLLVLLFLFNVRWIDVGWVNIWRRSEVQKLKLKRTGGIFILTEIVVRFTKKGLRIDEAPSYYHIRTKGEVKNDKKNVVFNTLLSALRLKLELMGIK